jgi:hypothetical protein
MNFYLATYCKSGLKDCLLFCKRRLLPSVIFFSPVTVMEAKRGASEIKKINLRKRAKGKKLDKKYKEIN